MGTQNSRETINNLERDRLKEIVEPIDIQMMKQRNEYPKKATQRGVDSAKLNLRPVQEDNFVEEKVLRIRRIQDGRTRVAEPQNWPHSVHGALTVKFNNLLYIATATMIGPNIAITAAHALYNLRDQIEVKISDINFYPAANDQLLPFGTVKVQAFYYPEEYKTTTKENYAILILEKDIGNQTGYFRLSATERQEIVVRKINITGYPADKVKHSPNCHQMWGMEGPICHLDDDLISYQIDTYAGQGGSGIWYEAGGEYYIIGVHTHSSSAYNQGTFLNKKRLERIQEWIQPFYLRPAQPTHARLQSINSIVDPKAADHQKIKEIIEMATIEQMKAQIFNLINYKSKCHKPKEAGLEMTEYNQEEDFVEEKVLKKRIPGKDGRIRVEKTREWPYSVHGLLSMKFNHASGTATATMIGPNIAITAAHAVYDFETKTEVTISGLYFYPGVNGQLKPSNMVKVMAFYYPEEYKTTQKEDYAILLLQQDIGYKTGYYGLHALERQEVKGKKVNVTGYPQNPEGYPEGMAPPDPDHHQMWGMEGPVCVLDNGDNLISYEMDASKGQSGGGIWYKTEDEYYIIGVHRGAFKKADRNYGTFFTKKRLERIREWIWSFYSERAQIQPQSLNLANKKIGESGAEYLSKSNFLQLQSLELPWNEIGEKGARYLSEANFPQLQSLNLSYNRIEDRGANYLRNANFTQLQSLHLVDNEIGEKGARHLSEANFPRLQSLNLCLNKIGEKGAEYLSKAKFLKLQSLDLFRNKIGVKGVKYLSDATFPQLRSLDLSYNQIGEEGSEYLSKAKFPLLHSLTLSYNQIGDKGAEYLSEDKFPQLQSLNLNNNNIGEKGAEYLSKGFFPLLQSLDLNNNNIGETGAYYLRDASFPRLQSFYLQKNQIGDRGAWYLSQASFPQLQSLDLHENQIGDLGIEYLSKADFPLLQSFNLRQNQIGNRGAAYLAEAKFPLLQSLNLAQNEVGEKGAEYLKKVNFSQLKTLDLSHNEIGEKGTEYLSQTNFLQLEFLYLSDNLIEDKGAEYLRKADFPKLQSLYLYRNHITEEGAEHLSKAKFPQLQILDLSHNPIGDKGAWYLSLANFQHLRLLYLSESQIGDEGARCMSEANFPMLQCLFLSHNQIGERGAKYLSKASFPQLYSLDLTTNQIGEKGAEHLQRMKSHHSNTVDLKINY